MRKLLLSFAFGMVTAGLLTSSASAESLFMKALKAKYEFRSVSCSTCHAKKDEVAPEDLAKYEENSKSVRNDFGKLFEPLLKGKKIEERVAEAKELKKEDKDAEADKIEESVQADFLEALKKVEAMKDEDTGKTYGEMLKAGEIDGVRLPE